MLRELLVCVASLLALEKKLIQLPDVEGVLSSTKFELSNSAN